MSSKSYPQAELVNSEKLIVKNEKWKIKKI